MLFRNLTGIANLNPLKEDSFLEKNAETETNIDFYDAIDIDMGMKMKTNSTFSFSLFH